MIATLVCIFGDPVYGNIYTNHYVALSKNINTNCLALFFQWYVIAHFTCKVQLTTRVYLYRLLLCLDHRAATLVTSRITNIPQT